MKRFLVTSDFMDKETGEIVTAGSTVVVDEERADSLRAAEVLGKQVDASNDPDDTDEVFLTTEEFDALSAVDQKDVLTKLEIEGDASNEEKRAALYAEFLSKAAGGGEE